MNIGYHDRKKCGAEMDFDPCDAYEDGVDGHDCGEDCGGKGGWWVCIRGEACRADSRHVASLIAAEVHKLARRTDPIHARWKLDEVPATRLARFFGISRRTARRARTYARRALEAA